MRNPGTVSGFAPMPEKEAAAGESSGTEHNLAHVLRESLACAILILDNQGKLRCANARAAAMFPPAEPGAIPAEIRALIDESLASGTELIDTEVTLATKGLRLSTVLLPQGKGPRVVAVLNDVSAVWEFEQHLQRLHRVASAGTSAASMAHEIKNALVAVRTFLDLLIEKNPSNEMAEMASREVRRINSLASQMLKLAGPSKAIFERIRLRDVLDHAFGLIQVQVTEKRLTVERNFAHRHPMLRGNAYQLEQAFVNLFLNAIDAMREGGKLTVSTAALPRGSQAGARLCATAPAAEGEKLNGPLLQITITDTGVGIPPENLARLFDTFFTTKDTGTGLGLTITRRIIREHGGDIEVQSELNRGTTFTVLLPALGD